MRATAVVRAVCLAGFWCSIPCTSLSADHVERGGSTRDPFVTPAQEDVTPLPSPLPPDPSPPQLRVLEPAAPDAGIGWFARPVPPDESGFDPVAPPFEPRGLGVFDPPIDYSGPPPGTVEDDEYRDGPRIPEPMVFDLVRGLGARRGELEFNILNLVPTRTRRKPVYEWAPEVEYAIFDGFAVEFELPIFNTEIQDLKFGAQYTFGTALDDALIHGVQGILQYNFDADAWTPTGLYLIGLRLNRTWSLFGMFGLSTGPQFFPFVTEPDARQGVELITNLSAFANLSDDLVFGVETNFARGILGPGEFLIMPQFHYDWGEGRKVQFGYGLRDDGDDLYGELGFRVIFER